MQGGGKKKGKKIWAILHRGEKKKKGGGLNTCFEEGERSKKMEKKTCDLQSAEELKRAEKKKRKKKKKKRGAVMGRNKKVEWLAPVWLVHTGFDTEKKKEKSPTSSGTWSPKGGTLGRRQLRLYYVLTIRKKKKGGGGKNRTKRRVVGGGEEKEGVPHVTRGKLG